MCIVGSEKMRNTKISVPTIPKKLCAALLMTAGLLGGAVSQAGETGKRNTGPSKPPSSPEAGLIQGNPADNLVTQAIIKSGAQDCRGRANQVVNYLAANSQSGAFIFLPQQADGTQRLTSASLEIRTPRQLGYASATFAPVGAGRCDAVYDAVVYWSENCRDVAAKSFAQFKPAGVVKQNVAILDGGPLARVFLMPAGAGCVSIKKEAVY